MVRRTQKRLTRKQTGSSKRRTRHRSRHRRRSKKMHEANHNQHGGKKKRRKSGGKRKLNEYFKAMLHAKKHKSASFKYNGATYKRVRRGHLDVYKKA